MYVGHLDPASNRAKLERSFQVIDADTGEGIDLTAFAITFSLRDRQSRSEVLTATDSDGIDIVDADEGFFTVEFTATQMRKLCAKEYEVGCTIAADADAEDVDQYIIGTIAVLDGVVS